jgi:hypothetical protein
MEGREVFWMFIGEWRYAVMRDESSGRWSEPVNKECEYSEG